MSGPPTGGAALFGQAPKAACAALLAAAALGAAGCDVAYVPGDEKTPSKASAANPGELRRLVQVIANRCTNRETGGVVSNSSTSALKVLVEAQMFTPAGVQRNVDVAVDLPAGKTAAWHVAAPAGTTADGGCQGYAKTIEVVGS